MKKRTIIENDTQFRNLLGTDTKMGTNSNPCYNDPNLDKDEDRAEFYITDDFSEKLDPTKESSIFANGILNRFMIEYDVNYKEVAFAGTRHSIVYFLSRLMDQYMRYRMLKYYKDENEDFLS